MFVVTFALLVSAYGIQFPDQGSNPGLLHWELSFLTSEAPGKLLHHWFCSLLYLQYQLLSCTHQVCNKYLLIKCMVQNLSLWSYKPKFESWCCRLNTCVHINSYIETLIPRYNDIWQRDLWQIVSQTRVWPQSGGISALVREDSRQLSPSHHYVRTQQEEECGKTGKRGLTRN